MVPMTMSTKRKVAVLGAGSWGTTFAKVLAEGDNDVRLWARRKDAAIEINLDRENSRYLPGIELPEGMKATHRIREAVEGAEIVFVSVPSQTARENLEVIADAIEHDAIVVSLMKGVEKATGKRMSVVLHETLGLEPERIAVASGPNLAKEIAMQEPTAVAIASASAKTAATVAAAVRNSYFHAFVNTDVIGTEYGGVLKNLIAVAVGIVDGVGYGDNTKASIITRGLAEVTAFAVAFGAQPATMSGLAGLGDLIATCESPLSRNNRAGRLLGEGKTVEQVAKRMNQTVEGIASVDAVLRLAESVGVSMPIVQQVSDVLEGRLSPAELAPHLTTETDEPQGE